MIETNLDKFKKSYILKKARELADNKKFKTSFTISRMSEYVHLLTIFWKENDTELNELWKSFVANKAEGNENFLRILSFITAVPNIIKIINDNEIEVNYDFLNKNFSKSENTKEINELHKNLKKLNQTFKVIKSNLNKLEKEIEFKLSDIYNFGQFILNFLNNPKIRIDVASKLINSELELESQKSKELMQEYRRKQKSNTTWNSKQTIRI